MKKKQKKYVASLTNQKHRNKIAYTFLTPWLIGAVCLSLLPAIMCFVFSFTDIRDIHSGYQITGNGIKNYANTLFGNTEVLPAIWQFIKTEIIYVPIILIMAFIISQILIKDIKAKSFFRTIFFLPVIIISGTLVSLIFETTSSAEQALQVADPLTSSFIYRIIASYSIQVADFVVDIFSQFVIILWLTGIPVILFINGLQKINKNMYEAASIDGANKWQILWKITIPNIMGIAFVCAIFSIVQISTLPVSDLYGLISAALARSDGFALSCTYSIIYVLIILLIIFLFKLVLAPREKKQADYVTITMKQQFDKTMKKINKGGKENVK